MMKRTNLLLLPLLLTACNAPAPTTPDASPPASPTTSPAPAVESREAPSNEAPASTSPAPAAWVLPGDFAPDTTLAQLETKFGKANVQITDVPMAEGETTRGVILFPNDPTRRATLYFQDEKNLKGLSGVHVEDAASLWHYDNGLKIGSTLDDVVKRNGKPVRFYGFSWDYGGFVSEWNGGKLAPAAGITRGIRLAPKTSEDAASLPEGDGEFSSDDPKFPKLGQRVVVEALQLGLPGADDL